MTMLFVPRLPVYPSYLADDERWLDGTGGISSVRAAALRSADAAGLTRGSNWCPGSSVGEREGRGDAVILPAPDAAAGVADDAEPQAAAVIPSFANGTATEGSHDGGISKAAPAREQDSAEQRRMPASGRMRRGQPWRVEVTEEGLLRGCPQPAPSARIADVLAAVLDGGHELTEAEMVLLFAARGADFQVRYLAVRVCVATPPALLPSAANRPSSVCRNNRQLPTIDLDVSLLPRVHDRDAPPRRCARRRTPCGGGCAATPCRTS